MDVKHDNVFDTNTNMEDPYSLHNRQQTQVEERLADKNPGRNPVSLVMFVFAIISFIMWTSATVVMDRFDQYEETPVSGGAIVAVALTFGLMTLCALVKTNQESAGKVSLDYVVADKFTRSTKWGFRGRGADWCDKCAHYRPERYYHDNASGHCLAKFDHYCPWTGNSIGHGNYTFFLAFLLMACMGCGLSLGIFFEHPAWHEGDLPGSGRLIVTAGLATFGFFFTLIMLVAHVKSILDNETTYEAIKCYDKANPYDHGSYYKNYQAFKRDHAVSKMSMYNFWWKQHMHERTDKSPATFSRPEDHEMSDTASTEIASDDSTASATLTHDRDPQFSETSDASGESASSPESTAAASSTNTSDVAITPPDVEKL